VVEASEENGGRDNKQEGDGCQDAMRLDEAVVATHVPEAIAHAYDVSACCGQSAVRRNHHTIVLCCSKIQALQVGKQECVSLRVPGPVAHIHGVGRVGTAPRCGQARHVAGWGRESLRAVCVRKAPVRLAGGGQVRVVRWPNQSVSSGCGQLGGVGLVRRRAKLEDVARPGAGLRGTMAVRGRVSCGCDSTRSQSGL
jgi:hypothetical protein